MQKLDLDQPITDWSDNPVTISEQNGNEVTESEIPVKTQLLDLLQQAEPENMQDGNTLYRLINQIREDDKNEFSDEEMAFMEETINSVLPMSKDEKPPIFIKNVVELFGD